MLSHIELEIIEEQKDDASTSEIDEGEDEVIIPKYREIVPKIHDEWIEL